MTDEKMPMWETNAKGSSVQLNLSQKAERVIQHLVDSKKATGTDLRGVKRTLTGKTDPASIQALLAIGGLISSILLSTAVLVSVATRHR